MVSLCQGLEGFIRCSAKLRLALQRLLGYDEAIPPGKMLILAV